MYEKYALSLYRIPMWSDHVRSLNLSTAAGVVLYEALRRL
jgi:tRNA (cytidine/uridine-2'-O-)-methyltransferase